MWVACGVTPDEVMAEFQRREGTSGLEEKRQRAKRPSKETERNRRASDGL